MIDEHRVLDHGVVRLVDHMGSDLSVSRSARVSYDAEAREGDDKLINYLMINGHNTPFESCVITFDVIAPIFVLRQWHRHRTQSYNELSARYRPLPEIYYVPDLARITTQSEDNKQMSSTEPNPDAILIQNGIERQNEMAFRMYHEMLALNCPRELARSVLPVGAYSHMFATANLFNWMRFLKERQHPHAQYEIRVYADAIAAILAQYYPISMAAFQEKYK